LATLAARRLSRPHARIQRKQGTPKPQSSAASNHPASMAEFEVASSGEMPCNLSAERAKEISLMVMKPVDTSLAPMAAMTLDATWLWKD